MAAIGGTTPSHQKRHRDPEGLQMRWLPHLLRRRKLGAAPLGLKNLGNSCYLNSVLQCLTYTPPLANFCLQYLHSSLCENQQRQRQEAAVDAGKRDCPFCILEKRIARSLNLNAPNDAPSRISSCLRLYAAHFQGGHQEDAHEFLRHVIDACHTTCLKAIDDGNHAKTTVLKEIFGGALLSQVRCLSCKCLSSKTDDIMDISLNLFQCKSLVDALRRFFQPELLDGDNKYSCDSCKKLSPAERCMFILQAPNVLVIQLKRFEAINGAKINRDISFEEVLGLSDFMSKASQDPKPEYNLFGSIVHSGYSPDSGHYYAYIKDPSGRWYCCNDSYVSLSSSEEVLAEKVYILFYLRGNQAPKHSKSILSSDELKFLGSNGKCDIEKSLAMAKTSENVLHFERNVSTATRNGKGSACSQIKFGLKKSQNNCSKNGHLKICNDANNGKENCSKQLLVSSKFNQLSSTLMASNTENSAFDPQVKCNRSSLADKSASLNGKGNAFSVSSVKETNASSDLEKSVRGLTVESGETSIEYGSGGSDCQSNKRKTIAESSILPIADVVKEDAVCVSYDIFADKLSSEGLECLINMISKKARAKLHSSGWVDEVHRSMHAQKRHCIKSADHPPDPRDLRKLLVAEASKTFTSRIPQDLKEDLIKSLRRSFHRGKPV